MQENEFEKQVRRQMEEFALVPNEEVWKKVETKIRKEKRRRLLFYWMFAGLVLTGALFFFNTRNSSQSKTVSSVKKPNDVFAKKPVVKNKDGISVAEKDLIKEYAKAQTDILQPSGATKETKILNNKKTYSSAATSKHDEPLAQAKHEVLNSFKKEDKILHPNNADGSNSLKSSLSKTRMEGRTKLPPHRYLLSQTDRKLQQDTLPKSTASAEDKTGITDTSVLPKKDDDIKQNKSKKTRKWIFGFTLYGGASDNVTGIGLVSDKSLATADANGSLSSPSSSSFSVPSASRLQYKSGASFGAGVYLQKELTRKLKVTVGVDYHYMSAKSVVGNKVDSTLSIYDTVLQKSTIIKPFYRAGQTTSYSNKYHLIQLPVNLQVQLNKNITHPVLFSFGLSPSFLITTNALYLNSNVRAYYREKEQFNRFMLFGQSELLYTVSNKPTFQLCIGPALQYGFNSFSKPATHTSQHLIFTGIKTSITFK